MRSLTEQQSAFAHSYVLGESAGNGTASAVAAGYAADSAKQAAYRLLRQDGVREEIGRLNREAITEYATASIHLLGRMVLDKNTHPKVALEAAKTILDRAGYIAPRSVEPTQGPQKPIESLTLADIDRLIAESKARVEELTDITPMSETVDVEAAAESDPPTGAS